jgi:RNA polymerase sigma-70 factor (ECF subfamily)
VTSSIGELFQQYHASLVRVLYRRTGDRDRAEDLAQEVFARAVATPPRNPRPWLFAVALNLVREDGRRAVVFDRDEGVAAVRAALATLTERDREALLLKAEGFNYAEIATTLELAKGAVGTTLARARRRLVEAYRAGEGARNAAS